MTCPTLSSSFVPSQENTRQLRDAFGQFATGVTIVTAQTKNGPLAITANSFSSVSLDPPLVLWCVDKTSKRYPAFVAAEHFAIHVLSTDQADLCWQVSRDGAALDTGTLDTNIDGVPILPHCLARFECMQSANYDAGDHAIILGQVLRASLAKGGSPLAFHAGHILQMEASR